MITHDCLSETGITRQSTQNFTAWICFGPGKDREDMRREMASEIIYTAVLIMLVVKFPLIFVAAKSTQILP